MKTTTTTKPRPQKQKPAPPKSPPKKQGVGLREAEARRLREERATAG